MESDPKFSILFFYSPFKLSLDLGIISALVLRQMAALTLLPALQTCAVLLLTPFHAAPFLLQVPIPMGVCEFKQECPMLWVWRIKL